MFLFYGCGHSTIDPSVFHVSDLDMDTFDLPYQCEYLYQQDTKVVAVTSFEDKTTFKSSIQNSGMAELGDFARSALESKVVSIGGVTVVARAQMEQILREQEFQMTIADPDTVVDFGRLLGAQYIITGTLDIINASYSAPMEQKSIDVYSNSTEESVVGLLVNLALMGGTAYANMDSGWNINVEATMNMINVSTAKIVATKRAQGEANAGDAPGFDKAQIIAGAKSAIGIAINNMTPALAAQFTPKGYINELRGEKSIALISMGADNGVSLGDTIQPYEITVRKDFMSGREDCVMTPLGFTMTVAAEPESRNAWVTINTTDKARLAKLKIGTLIQRTEVNR